MQADDQADLRPHWHRPHLGEHRWPVLLVISLVIVLQYSLPHNLSLSIQPLVCYVEAALLLVLLAINPRRISSHVPTTQVIGIVLVAITTLSNTASAIKLINAIITQNVTDARSLLGFGGSIWITNVVVFGLWYWELDRGGPGKRAEAVHPYPDFIFPQMSDPLYAPQTWHPNFFDYLYTSFTNASAFSPTDVMPLTRWAKMLMLFQSMTALLMVGLVFARAVNILH